MKKKIQIQLEKPSSKQGTRVRIPWMHGDTVSDWNKKCIFALEHFGLPGNETYICHATEDYMDFYFVREEDAIIFSLKCL